MPTDEWYKNEDVTLKYIPMTFSQENFVTGFDLTVGQYYKLAKALANYIRTNQLHTKDIRRDRAAELKCWSVYERLMNNKDLDDSTDLTIPPKWKSDMIWAFISAMSTFVKNNHAKLEAGDWPQTQWTWGPHRVSKSSASKNYQYQHMKVQITKVHLLELAAVPSESEEHEENMVATINMRGLLKPEHASIPITPRDLEPNQFRLRILLQGLQSFGQPPFIPTHEKLSDLMFSYIDEEGDEQDIKTQDDFETALQLYREEGKRIISLQLKRAGS